MKTNLPVTQKEAPYPPGSILVSKTDLKGSITYANMAFIEMSGFSKAELYGKNHNLVRHPDMPAEAFKDLWETVKQGRPWRGIVKNRRKDGDHYWVDAMVVPLRKNNQTIGFMSVRREPSRQQVEAAEQLYRQVKDKKRTLKRRGLMDMVYRYSFRTRYAVFASTMVALTAVAAFAGASGMLGLAVALIFTEALLAVTSSMFLSRTMCGPLLQAIQFFDQIAQGNLDNDIAIDGNDLSGQLVSSVAYTQTHLRVIIDEISRAAANLQNRCDDLQQEVAHVAAHSEEQQDRVANVSAAIEQVSTSVTQVADSTDEAASSARSTLLIVNEGNVQMRRSLESVSRVVQIVQTSNNTLNELSESIAKVGLVTNVIREIADQTNLLALNAAIEAARAGEQGRGFAVVADEVRSLAERTSESTSHIAQIVGEIQKTALSAVASMSDAVQEVEQGIDMLQQSNASLQQITAASQSVTDAASHIASATNEQSTATEDVAKNMEHISTLINGNGDSILRVQQSVGELLETSAELQELVGHFDAAKTA